MSFMKPELYKGEAYVIDGKAGGEVVPLDVCGDLGQPTEENTLEIATKMADYLENKPADVFSIERLTGWLYRLSAPGYMDCTPWGIASRKKDAERALRDL